MEDNTEKNINSEVPEINIEEYTKWLESVGKATTTPTESEYEKEIQNKLESFLKKEGIEPDKEKEEPFVTFMGSHNPYAIIAKRGNDRLALNMEYVIHPQNGIGFLLFRFVLKTPSLNSFGAFKTFTPRSGGKFKYLSGEEFEAIRLDKLAIPVFNPGPPPMTFLTVADNCLVWNMVSDWVIERCKENGFSMVIEALPEVLKGLVSGKFITVHDQYAFIIHFPQLKDWYGN